MKATLEEIKKLIGHVHDQHAEDFWECSCEKNFHHHVAVNAHAPCGSVYKTAGGQVTDHDLPNPLLSDLDREFNGVATISYEQWHEIYSPIEEDGYLRYFDDAPQGLDARYNWTFLSCDIIVPGRRYVNAVGHIVTRMPWGHKDIEVVQDER